MQLASVNHSTSVGADGANIVTSTVTVSECHELGEYKCVLLESGEERNVVVDGNTVTKLHYVRLMQ